MNQFKFNLADFKKNILYLTIVITLPLIYYNSVSLRENVKYKNEIPYGRMEYQKKEPYAIMKFAEMLDEKFKQINKIFDGTDGNFALARYPLTT